MKTASRSMMVWMTCIALALPLFWSAGTALAGTDLLHQAHQAHQGHQAGVAASEDRLLDQIFANPASNSCDPTGCDYAALWIAEISEDAGSTELDDEESVSVRDGDSERNAYAEQLLSAPSVLIVLPDVGSPDSRGPPHA